MRRVFHQHPIMYMRKNGETRDRDTLCPPLIPERFIGILTCLSVPLVLQLCLSVIFTHRLNTSRRGAAGVARWMDGLVGRAAEGSSGRLSRTPRATPAVIPGKVGEGIANSFPNGALLAPRASGKPLPMPVGMALPPAPTGAKPMRPMGVKTDSKGLRNLLESVFMHGIP